MISVMQRRVGTGIGQRWSDFRWASSAAAVRSSRSRLPLMVYVVGVPDAHVAIGTSAIAVAANAAVNLSNHARGGTVVWSCALMFAAAGIIGAFTGSIFGKMLDGQKLLALFALLMLVIALLMLKTRSRIGLPDVKMNWPTCPPSSALGLPPARCPASSASAAAS